MIDDFHTLGCSVSEEIDSTTVEILLVGFCVHNVGLYRAHLAEGTVEDLRIHFHSAGVEHRHNERIFLGRMLAKEHGHSQQLECRHGDELCATAIAKALGHTHSYAKTRIRTRTATYCHSLERNIAGINVTDSLIDEHAQLNCMVGTAVIFLVENHGSIITNCHRAHVGTRLNT